MEKFSLKSLLTIVVILLIGIVAIWRINQGPKKVEAGWFNEAWSYRKAITLTNSGAGQTDVYVAITIDTSDTTRFQADGGDIRFTKQNGELLPYYIVSGAGTASTVIHINFDIYPAGASTFYLYYGNSSAENGFSATDFTTAASNSSTNLLTEELSPAPIAYWSFNEGTGSTVYDSSSNQKNGVLSSGTSAPTWSSNDECLSGNCLFYKGSSTSYVDTNYDFDLNYDSSSTISFWFKTSVTNTGGLVKNIIAKNNYQFIISQENQSIRFIQWQPTGSNALSFNTTNFIQANNWYYINFIYDSTQHKGYFYVNGKLNSSGNTSSSDFKNNSETLKIGTGYQYGGSTSPHFTGYIDEVKIYNYARSTDQIKQDYNAGLAGISSMEGGSVNVGGTQVRNIKDHLVAHYKFDEGYGNTVNNFSSLGTTLNGTLGSGNSAPTWTTGKNNKGLLFDGDDYIDLPNDLTYTDEVSAFAWFKSLGDPPGGYHIIFGGSQLEISIPSSGQIRTGINTSARYVSNHGSGITDGNWHYVGFTFDGSTKNSYIDGEYVGQQTGIEGALVNSFSSRRIGRFGSSSTYFANGLIDEVKIYNTALSDAEIKLDYNQGSQFVMGKTNQTIGGTTTSLEYCIPGDTSHCSAPIAEYKFDEGIGTSAFDTSGNNNNCLTSNNPFWTIGKVGKALEFNGTNQRCTKASGIGTSFITIQAWLYRTSSSQNQGIVRQPSAFAMSLYNNTIQVAPGNNWTFYNTGITIPQNSWEHIAWTYDGSIMKVFKNGQIGWTASLTGSFPTNTQDLHIGYDNNNWWWGGKIDQVRIYNYARTPAQIAYDYNKGAPVGWWKFDECEGTTINDWAAPPAGGANHGTLTIGVGGSQSTVGTCQSSGAWYNGKDGKINSAMSFDGTDDYVSINSLGSTLTSTTISAWIKISSSTGTWQVPLALGSNPTINIGCESSDNQKCGCDLYNAVTNPINIGYNNWTLITCVKTPSGMTQYINGKYSSYESNASSITNPIINIARGRTNEYYTRGLIDDVRIYNYALTSEQVKQIYNGGAVNFR